MIESAVALEDISQRHRELGPAARDGNRECVESGENAALRLSARSRVTAANRRQICRPEKVVYPQRTPRITINGATSGQIHSIDLVLSRLPLLMLNNVRHKGPPGASHPRHPRERHGLRTMRRTAEKQAQTDEKSEPRRLVHYQASIVHENVG